MTENCSDDLERKIILMEQELIFKRSLLVEYKQKLDTEIAEHLQTKTAANKYLNENKELQIQLEVCMTGAKKLEEENSRNRELLVKLKAQACAYASEKQQLVDKAYQSEKENNALKAEIKILKEQLKTHLEFLNNFEQRKNKTETLINEIITKQEVLNKEQSRLESVCKEGLQFAEKLSEEAKFQARFVSEAKLGQTKMEKEMVHLMAALNELKVEKEYNQNTKICSEESTYLEEWKSHQKEMKIRNEELQEVNQRLHEELNLLREQIEILLQNNCH